MSSNTFPPAPSPLLTFPKASLSHIIGTHSFPLSTGPCSLVEVDSPEMDGKSSLALSIPPNTTVVLSESNVVRKTDQNEAHASYSFNFSPSPSSSSKLARSSSGGASSSDLLPTSSSDGDGHLKLTLPEAKNQDEYDALTTLASTFESHLATRSLLDTRPPPDLAEDRTESLSYVLSNWSTSIVSGVRETASVVYTGVGEYAGMAGEEVRRDGVWGTLKRVGEGVKDIVSGPVDKGKGREVVERGGERDKAEEGWEDVIGEKVRGSNKSLPTSTSSSSSSTVKEGYEMSSSASAQEASHHADQRV